MDCRLRLWGTETVPGHQQDHQGGHQMMAAFSIWNLTTIDFAQQQRPANRNPEFRFSVRIRSLPAMDRTTALGASFERRFTFYIVLRYFLLTVPSSTR